MIRLYTSTITRPNNADLFTARDVIGTATTHVHTIKSAGESGFVFNAEVVDSVHTSTHQVEIWLFSAAPAAQADNAAFAPSDEEMLTHIGTIVCDSSLATGANRIMYPSTRPALAYFGPLYACLVVVAGTTPAANEAFTIKLHVSEQ